MQETLRHMAYIWEI